ncbi:MAG: hypothetical protein BZ136_01465 [Methanosphaera sp. rholeuAM74]|nr:MAG: hypothetical protein BZ136_01465 [Methanosphaera sp. rholeuAM74]
MDKSSKIRITRAVWLIIDAIFVVCAVVLFFYGDVYDIIIACVGLVLIVIELYLMKKGKFLGLA